MNLCPQSPIPAAAFEPAGNEQMVVQILSAQTDQAHERDDSAPLFIP